MRYRDIIYMARTLSLLFNPFYLPIVGLIVLFTFTYLSLLPWGYKLFTLAMVYVFTIFMPTLLIRLYRSYHGWTPLELGAKERRVIPYLISFLCYFACYYTLMALHVPHVITGILMAALAVQIGCSIINMWWKISMHTAAVGGVAGALMAFAEVFSFNPVWWLCLVIIIAGLLGSSRMILRQHSLRQVTAGFLIGIIAAYLTITLT